MKTVLKTLSTLALLSTTAFAGDGFYLGAGVGMLASDSKIKKFESDQVDRFGARDKSAVGQIAVGYDWVFMKHLLIGLEGDGRVGPNDSETFALVDSNLRGRIKQNWALGLAARLGLKVNALKVYFRVGGDFGRLKFDYVNVNLHENDIHSTKSIFGVTPGIGLSHDVNENWTVGLEGRTTFFKKKRFAHKNPTGDSLINVKHRSDTFLFNVRYFFN